MVKAVENTEVFTDDTSTATEQDNVEQQESIGTKTTDGSRKSVANKARFNQLSFKSARFQAVAEDARNVHKLPVELVKYENKYIGIFVSD